MHSVDKPILPVIAGPTASGKTACAVALARLIGGEIISADSMQIYRGMNVLSAIPTPEEMQGVAHHMIAFAPPTARYSADAYREDANACIADVLSRGRMPILCGGTGLYINAVTRPMSFSTLSDEALHAQLLASAQDAQGRLRLYEELRRIDPQTAVRLHPNDVRRVSRAIEVYRLTGVTQSEHARMDANREGDYREAIFAVDWPREQLYERINARVEEMLSNGLIDEVRALTAHAEAFPTAAQAIGYKEIAAALRGEMSMDEAVEWLKKSTRNYAKRQLTWFRRDPRVVWLAPTPGGAEALARRIRDLLEQRFGEEALRCREPEQ